MLSDVAVKVNSSGHGSMCLTTGERIRLRREARGMTRPVLAGLVGRSSDWLKKIENGDRRLTSLPLLVELARRLDLHDVSELTGSDLNAPSVSAWTTDVHHVVPNVRRAIHEVSFASSNDTSANLSISATELSRRVRDLWLVWHTSPMQRSQVGEALPALIRQAHASIRLSEGDSRRACRAATGELYRLVQRLLAHICESELHALAVERGRALSEEADSPLSLANAAWASSVSLCAGGYFGEAAELARRATETVLESSQGNPDVTSIGTIGALQLESAAAHGLAGHEGDAFRYLDAAAVTASRMPLDAWHLPSAFNRTNVEILAVIVSVGLRRNGEAISLMRKINVNHTPSVVRRSRLLLETAQAHSNRREGSDAVRAMHGAMKISPEAVALIPWARTLADDLVKLAPRTAKPVAASALSVRVM